VPRIVPDRLLADLAHLRTFGAQGSGVVRPAFSAHDMAARRWLRQRFGDAGLDARIDGVGNVLGIARAPGPALLLGSHSDTQPTGGWLDGAYGVVAALEVARALAEDAATRHLAVDVVAFQDEEARFLGCLGSRALVGALPASLEDGVRDADGVPLADALAAAGLAETPRAVLDRARYVGFIEAHIEQGPVLDDGGARLGVVTGIVGLRAIRFVFRGAQNHAGTTSMARRRDASAALYALAHAINAAFPEVAGERSVWTMGRVRVEPNAASIVPGYAELDLQFRDPDNAPLDRMQQRALELAAQHDGRHGVRIEAHPARAPIAPTTLDAQLRSHLEAAAERHAPGRWQRLPSGAFHDAGIIAGFMPAAMLFVPSLGGVSHDFSEDTRADDLVLGAAALADAATAILLARRRG
jgi:N-carbamoyl-L-amino-acid hydrolase